MKVTDATSPDTPLRPADDSKKPSKDFSRLLAEKKNKGAEEKRSRTADAKAGEEAAAKTMAAMAGLRDKTPVGVQQKATTVASLPATLEGLVHEITVAAGTEKQTHVDIQLNSTALDGLRISLTKQDGGVAIQFLSRTPEVASLLSAHTAQLTQALAARGVEVSSIRVRTAGSRASSGAERQRPGRQG